MIYVEKLSFGSTSIPKGYFLREYGLDFKERVEKAGFEVDMVNYTENFSEEIKLKYGLQINDVIPIARKSFGN